MDIIERMNIFHALRVTFSVTVSEIFLVVVDKRIFEPINNIEILLVAMYTQESNT